MTWFDKLTIYRHAPAKNILILYPPRILPTDILLGLLIVLVAALTLTGVMHLLILRMPYIPTSMRLVRAMVEMARLQGHETVMDLGAGDGRLLITAKRLHPGVKAIGCELVPTIWLLGKLRILLSGESVDFRLCSLFSMDLSRADALFLYVTPRVMEELEHKCQKELKRGTIIISHAFRFPHKKPTEERRVNGETVVRYEW